MSEDLISRKALMEEISNSFSIPILKMNLKPEHMTIIKIEEIIRNMPTAYDKGKVEKKINNLKEHAENRKKQCYVETSGYHYYSGMLETLDVVEQIIKKGGIA